MKNMRPFGWVIIIFNGYWFYKFVTDVSQLSDSDVAVGFYLLMSLFIWAVINVILYVLYRVTAKSKSRTCPACGSGVKVGITKCEKCGFDFMKAASGGTNS